MVNAACLGVASISKPLGVHTWSLRDTHYITLRVKRAKGCVLNTEAEGGMYGTTLDRTIDVEDGVRNTLPANRLLRRRRSAAAEHVPGLPKTRPSTRSFSTGRQENHRRAIRLRARNGEDNRPRTVHRQNCTGVRTPPASAERPPRQWRHTLVSS